MRKYIQSGIFLACALIFIRTAQGEDAMLPRGFIPVGNPECFGPPGQELENGSIYNYMDGGGIVYLDHGFRELVNCEFSNSLKGLITFDRFTMETEAQALAALADQRIAPEGGSPLPLSVPNKAYRFPPDYYLYLVLGKQLIYFHVNDDQLADTLDQFVTAVLKSMKENKE
jgi:hypothetical protein